MAVKDSGQLSLADALRFRRPGLNERLEKIEALIDWLRDCQESCARGHSDDEERSTSPSTRAPARSAPRSSTSAEVNATLMAGGKADDSLGIKYRIQTRPNKHRARTARQTRRNTLIGRIGGRVATVFGFLKRNSWLARARTFNKARNAAAFALLCTAYNLHKAIRIA